MRPKTAHGWASVICFLVVVGLLLLLAGCGGGESSTGGGGAVNAKMAGRIPVHHDPGMEKLADVVVRVLQRSRLSAGYAAAFEAVYILNTGPFPCAYRKPCNAEITGSGLTGVVRIAGKSLSGLGITDARVDRWLAHELDHKVSIVVNGHSNQDHKLPLVCMEALGGAPMNKCKLNDYLGQF